MAERAALYAAGAPGTLHKAIPEHESGKFRKRRRTGYNHELISRGSTYRTPVAQRHVSSHDSPWLGDPYLGRRCARATHATRIGQVTVVLEPRIV